MNAGARLTIYGIGVVVAFGGAFGLASAIVPRALSASGRKVRR